MLWWILGTTVALVIGGPAILAGIGMTLPKGHVSTRTVDLPAEPGRVWAAITDFRSYPSWRSDVKTAEAFTAPEGGAVGWAETGKNGRIPFVIERSVEPRELLVRIADPGLPFGGTWTYELAPAESGGTRLTITERGEVYNPIFRFVSHFFFDPASTIERYQRDLRTHLAGPANSPI